MAPLLCRHAQALRHDWAGWQSSTGAVSPSACTGTVTWLFGYADTHGHFGIAGGVGMAGLAYGLAPALCYGWPETCTCMSYAVGCTYVEQRIRQISIASSSLS